MMKITYLVLSLVSVLIRDMLCFQVTVTRNSNGDIINGITSDTCPHGATKYNEDINSCVCSSDSTTFHVFQNGTHGCYAATEISSGCKTSMFDGNVQVSLASVFKSQKYHLVSKGTLNPNPLSSCLYLTSKQRYEVFLWRDLKNEKIDANVVYYPNYSPRLQVNIEGNWISHLFGETILVTMNCFDEQTSSCVLMKIKGEATINIPDQIIMPSSSTNKETPSKTKIVPSSVIFPSPSRISSRHQPSFSSHILSKISPSLGVPPSQQMTKSQVTDSIITSSIKSIPSSLSPSDLLESLTSSSNSLLSIAPTPLLKTDVLTKLSRPGSETTPVISSPTASTSMLSKKSISSIVTSTSAISPSRSTMISKTTKSKVIVLSSLSTTSVITPTISSKSKLVELKKSSKITIPSIAPLANSALPSNSMISPSALLLNSMISPSALPSNSMILPSALPSNTMISPSTLPSKTVISPSPSLTLSKPSQLLSLTTRLTPEKNQTYSLFLLHATKSQLILVPSSQAPAKGFWNQNITRGNQTNDNEDGSEETAMAIGIGITAGILVIVFFVMIIHCVRHERRESRFRKSMMNTINTSNRLSFLSIFTDSTLASTSSERHLSERHLSMASYDIRNSTEDISRSDEVFQNSPKNDFSDHLYASVKNQHNILQSSTPLYWETEPDSLSDKMTENIYVTPPSYFPEPIYFETEPDVYAKIDRIRQEIAEENNLTP